jgi:aspartate/methionine/tyrosine aminotransferase
MYHFFSLFPSSLYLCVCAPVRLSSACGDVAQVVMTTPSNPGGLVWGVEETRRLVDLCRAADSWLVVDQTYHEFLFDGAVHTYPCADKFDYEKIIHLFSFSKSFGMPGWRVGYIAAPSVLTPSLRKVRSH